MAVAIESATEADTVALAAQLAERLRAGDTVLLRGELGAGKTTFARALLRSLLGDPSLVVPSPTFNLVQPYEGRGRHFLHIDLYRIGDPREADELGLFDDPEAIRLIEWPDRLPGLAADFRVTLVQTTAPDRRGIKIDAPRQPARLDGLAAS